MTCMYVLREDVAQASLGLVGLLTAAAWMLSNRSVTHPGPSIGFPGYLYPDDATCEMYNVRLLDKFEIATALVFDVTFRR